MSLCLFVMVIANICIIQIVIIIAVDVIVTIILIVEMIIGFMIIFINIVAVYITMVWLIKALVYLKEVIIKYYIMGIIKQFLYRGQKVQDTETKYGIQAVCFFRVKQLGKK